MKEGVRGRFAFVILKPMNAMAWVIFVWAAILEVGGDALIRKGLRSQGSLLILSGFLALGFYGLMVNIVRWDFSRMLGVYVSVFAVVSILAGRYVFNEAIPMATWLGLAIIVTGGLVIQFGSR